MRQYFANVCQNVVNNAASQAVACGQVAVRIDSAAKCLLGRKRLSRLASYEPETMRPGIYEMPGQRGRCHAASGSWHRSLRTFQGTRPSTAGEMPPAIWATFVIARALTS